MAFLIGLISCMRHLEKQAADSTLIQGLPACHPIQFESSMVSITLAAKK